MSDATINSRGLLRDKNIIKKTFFLIRKSDNYLYNNIRCYFANFNLNFEYENQKNNYNI